MYEIVYHPQVRKDLEKIHKKHIQVMREVIETKLAERPEEYGKPLRSTLKPLRSLRIGNYRIVYAVQKKKLIVLILTIAQRDKVYKEAERRIGN